MRFTDFLKATVLISAGAATALAAITVARVSDGSQTTLVFVSAGWWLVAAGYGVWLGRGSQASVPIARLLAAARTSAALPEVSPGRVLLNRLFENPIGPRLADLRLPTLVISGEFDPLVPPSLSERVAAAIPGAQYTVIRRAAHNPMDERPREFNAALLNFLNLQPKNDKMTG